MSKLRDLIVEAVVGHSYPFKLGDIVVGSETSGIADYGVITQIDPIFEVTWRQNENSAKHHWAVIKSHWTKVQMPELILSNTEWLRRDSGASEDQNIWVLAISY